METLINIIKTLGAVAALLISIFLFFLGLFVPILVFLIFCIWTGMPAEIGIVLTLIFSVIWAVLYPAIVFSFGD